MRRVACCRLGCQALARVLQPISFSLLRDACAALLCCCSRLPCAHVCGLRGLGWACAQRSSLSGPSLTQHRGSQQAGASQPQRNRPEPGVLRQSRSHTCTYGAPELLRTCRQRPSPASGERLGSAGCSACVAAAGAEAAGRACAAAASAADSGSAMPLSAPWTCAAGAGGMPAAGPGAAPCPAAAAFRTGDPGRSTALGPCTRLLQPVPAAVQARSAGADGLLHKPGSLLHKG